MIISTAALLTGDEVDHHVPPGFVVIESGKVAATGQGRPPQPPNVELPDGFLVPGLVDIQVNGYYGVEFQTADAARWSAVARRLPATGTTAFMPTMITAPLDELAHGLRTAAGFVPALEQGARVLGVHVEGPFISPARRGAHNPAWITDPSPDAVRELLTAGAGVLRIMTIAPERPGALEAIGTITKAGVLASVGHSDATAAVVEAAASAGARMVTHLFNAQRPLGHREPGVVGQALTDPRLTSGLIVDLFHVSRAACQIAFAAAPGRIALVTDAAACAGMPPGEYLLGGEPITLPAQEGAPPVRADGTIAGSALRMDQAVAHAVSCGLPLPAAVAAASRIPADLIGRADLGRIAPGAAADMVWLSPDLTTWATWIGGRLVYTDDAVAPVLAAATA
jgi:N-acetylglucosamine-6-phosphate deacetylase